MRVFCYAYEGMYQGLHGIEDKCVMEVSDDINVAIEEINEWGNEASEELIYTFGLEDEYMSDADEDEDDIYDSIYYEDRGWYAHKIKDSVILSIDELEDICYCHDEKYFIKEYCDKENLV